LHIGGGRRNLKLYQKHLEDYLNMQYIGEMYIGKSSQKLDLLFDTGSAYTWLPLARCTECPHQTFDDKKSYGSFYEKTFSSTDTTLLFRGKEAKIEGSYASDKFSLFGSNFVHHDTEEEKKAIKQGELSGVPERRHFNFLAAATIKDLEWGDSEHTFGFHADGVLGLSPE